MKIQDLKTQVYKGHHGWKAETSTEVKGQDYEITTSKNSRGFIVCTAQECTAIESGNGTKIVSFDMFGSKRHELASLKANATEKTIKETHEAGLLKFIETIYQPSLNAPEPYKIEVGQIVFTDFIQYSNEEKRVIYEIINKNEFKTVSLDGSRTHHDSRIKPYTERFGIGVYYNEGEKLDISLIPDLLAKAEISIKEREEEENKAYQVKKEEAAKKAEYLSQFIRADKRQTTNLIKKHIFSLSPLVSKVEVTSDSYSGGDSCHVKYFAPVVIEEVESFINSLQEGRFNGMEDIYEYDREALEVIIENHILVKYKYTSARHEEAEAPEIKEVAESANIEPVTVEAGKIQVIEYGKGLAVIGDTKAIKDKLKALGGRFNFRLTCGAGWVFKKSDLEKLQTALSN